MIKKGELYYPTKDFQKKTWLKTNTFYKEAAKDPVKFWEKLAKEIFWFKPWKKSFLHNPPYFQWFVDGKVNITSNIFEKNPLGFEKIKNKTALIWEPEPIEEKPRILTYQELFLEVNKLSNALKRLGVKKGDRVGIYLPMIPEIIISMLACARIGAIHTLVFSAFSPAALKIRLQITEAKVLITADGYYRRGQIINLKQSADQGIKETKVEKVIVVKRTENKIPWHSQKDFWWHKLMKDKSDECKAEIMDSEDPLFILPESGTMGQFLPILHTIGGYTVQAYWTGKWIFDLHPGDIFWCTADPGWITGHTYTVYSPLLNGVTTCIFEGAPDWPTPDRWAQIIEKHKVTIFYTAPTAIRMFKKYGAEILKKYEFRSLRLLGSVGEPIDESAWLWYFNKVGRGKCPIVDTWWQTETGGHMIAPLPFATATKPGSATFPLPGVFAEVVDMEGVPVEHGQGGLLVVTRPWPSMLRGIWGDEARYRRTYWQKFEGRYYFAGDGAHKDDDGYYWIMGRVDDVLNVSGHRLGTMEIESALASHPAVAEAAVVGRPDEIKGEAICVFVVLKQDETEGLRTALRNHVAAEIGPIAKPDDIRFADKLPKTRSGKIMRRLLRDIAAGREITQDMTTLEDLKVIEQLQGKG